MAPNIQEICDFLDSYKIPFSHDDIKSEFITNHQLGGYDVAIKAKIPLDFPCSLPTFQLVERNKFGGLAHVSWGEIYGTQICYGKDNNLNTDFHRPGKVFLEALNRALSILEKSMNDKDYNKRELLREFAGVWRCHSSRNSRRLICIAEPNNQPSPLIIRSSNKGATGYFGSAFYAIDPLSPCNEKNFFTWNSQDKGRNIQGKGISIPISPLLLPPEPDENIGSWWQRQLSALPKDIIKELKRLLKKTSTRDFYIVCHGRSNGESIWFGIYCHSKTKKYAPITLNNFDLWDFQAINVDVISQDLLVPRGGGSRDLGNYKVCIVGCGSIGGYIGDMLASSGIGRLTLIDNDLYKIENLHRHVSNPIYLYCRKVNALKYDLEHKYPFVKVTSLDKKLLEIEDVEFWKDFDAVIVAIGAASHERKFNEFVRENNINTPVITTWVEPYGVGGHAVATIPEEKGCLACTYIDNESDLPDLYPNISFVERDQYVLESLGGCGTEFMAFSSIDAIQTATVASKLCIRSIKGEVSHGTAVSWRSDSIQARNKGIRFTHRYLKMKCDFKAIDIARVTCPVCGRGSEISSES